MNNIEITKELFDAKNFIGVFPRDKLPLKVKYPSTLVINTDKASDPGEHWVALHFSKNKFGEYIDSFGLPPIHESVINFITNNATIGYAYNTQTFQNLYSSARGWYCVIVVKMRNNGFTLCDILHELGRNSIKDDVKAKLIERSILAKNPCSLYGRFTFFNTKFILRD